MASKTLTVANFANSKHLSNPVCIAKTSPNWWNPPDKAFEPRLAPGDYLWEYKRGRINEEEYTRHYLAQLEDLDEHGYDWDLLIGKALICWCARGKFCHRNILADFLEEKGFEVTRS